MSDMSRAARIASLCFVALIGALRPGPARAADWLDEMPAVPVVVQAVREQLELNRLNPGAYPAYVGGDADRLASTITGTLVLLRWFMEFESRGEWFMLPARRAERRARMEAIALDYMQVEYAMGLGVRKHRGSIKTGCDRPDTYLNRLNRKMYVGEECYRFAFRRDIAIYSSYSYRQSIFPRLFCKSGQANHERFHKNFTGSGSNFVLTSPGVTLQLPGGQKPLGAALCKSYGGDANGNGLCDAWEKPLAGGVSGQASLAACGSGANFNGGCVSRAKNLDHPLLGARFKTMEQAAQAASRRAWQRSLLEEQAGNQAEFGGAIYQIGLDDFRFVPPVMSPIAPAPNENIFGCFLVRLRRPCPGRQAAVQGSDMDRAYADATAPLACQSITPTLVATYHSHPPEIVGTYLSIIDINAAISDKRPVYMIGKLSENKVGIQKYAPVHGHERVPAIAPRMYCGCVLDKDEFDAAVEQQRKDVRRGAIEDVPLAPN